MEGWLKSEGIRFSSVLQLTYQVSCKEQILFCFSVFTFRDDLDGVQRIASGDFEVVFHALDHPDRQEHVEAAVVRRT